eukprot:218537-Pleurochrysis_carterae.AAC.1
MSQVRPSTSCNQSSPSAQHRQRRAASSPRQPGLLAARRWSWLSGPSRRDADLLCRSWSVQPQPRV